MKKYFQLFIILISLLSCSKDNSNAAHAANGGLAGKTFDHLWFENQQDCMDAQPDPNFFINCHRELHFIDDETAEIMLTDMLITVAYQVEGNTITLNFSGDQSASLVFEKVDESSFKLLADDTIWRQRTGSSIWN